MTWEEFNPEVDNDIILYIKTKIECPNCKRYLIRDTKIVHTSHLPKHHYLCDCGWEGYK